MLAGEPGIYSVLSSRLMIGGRIYSRGDIVTISNFSLMRAAVRSGAVKALAQGLTTQLQAMESNPTIEHARD